MTTELFRDDNSGDRRDCDFDPVAEGVRHQLGAEVSLAIWEYVARQLTDYGSRDKLLIQQCFREVAARIAARGGRLAPDIGRTTRVDIELGEAVPAVQIAAQRRHGKVPGVPGRTTLVLVEDHRSVSRSWASEDAAVRPVRPGARRQGATQPASATGIERIARAAAHAAQRRRGRRTGGPQDRAADAFAARFVTRLVSLPRTDAREPPRSPCQGIDRAVIPDPKWEQLFGGASIEIDKPARVSAPLGILLKVKPAPHAAKVSPLIPFGDLVHVARTSSGEAGTVRWAYVVATRAGVSGFIEERFLAFDRT